ncbi:hypothetical protein H8356DRAFT_1682774 [Neocallimastix lanati (nom. inval.)]|nr:hypothetical protein H8356DRAFT_1682774 [Neocallimastix sp. JGI-2020a]
MILSILLLYFILYNKELVALNFSKLNTFMLIYCGLFIFCLNKMFQFSCSFIYYYSFIYLSIYLIFKIYLDIMVHFGMLHFSMWRSYCERHNVNIFLIQYINK